MPAAIILAMQLRNPQRLLFESIGFLQDSTFESAETDANVRFYLYVPIFLPGLISYLSSITGGPALPSFACNSCRRELEGKHSLNFFDAKKIVEFHSFLYLGGNEASPFKSSHQ